MEKVSLRLRKAIELRNVKQADLIEKTGISKGALSSYLSDRYKPKQDNIYLLAQALNVSETWLMGLDVPMDRDAEPSEDHAPEERELLGYFRKLNDVGKQKALDELSMYTQIPALTQEGLSQQTDIA